MAVVIALFYLLLFLLNAWITMKIAELENRNKKLAFFLGFLFGYFAAIGYLLAGKKEK